MEMRRDVDPWVRAMGVLAGDATDGLCGAFGNWEGLRYGLLGFPKFDTQI
jgi:hypothetical protein